MKVWKFSKYIAAALVLTIGAAVWAGYETAKAYERSPILPVSEEEQAEDFQKHQAQYIWKTSQYNRVAFVNLEKDYYAVQRVVHMEGYPSWTGIMNRDGILIKDLSEYGIEYVHDENSLYGYYSQDYVVALDRESDLSYVINRDTLEVYPTGVNFITMHPVTGYYIPEQNNKDIGYEVRSPEGEILLESKDPIQMTSEPGYVIRTISDQNVTQLMDMETGEVLYESQGKEVIEDYDHGFLRINGTAPGKDREGNPGTISCCYMLGSDFKPALGGRLFKDRMSVTSKYIYGEAIFGGYLDGEDNRETMDGQWNTTVVVYNHDGQLLFEGQQGDFLLEPMQGDTLAVCRRSAPDRDWKYVYVKLAEGGPTHE